ncbi:GNAT family N-acetyltransferase [Chitinophaga varians]|nr:GNAT family N-acetyltransferase [Chitinophaga varians]
MMNFSIQPRLENERAILYPLQQSDFEALYEVASDPLVWEQHPNKTRWQRPVFETYFDGAMKSGGAFRIVDKATGRTAGSSRFYDYDPQQNSILIGYTFYSREFWGSGLNPSVKHLMLSWIFQYVDKVIFHVGAVNTRSQIAMTRLGARKVKEEEVAYFGEPSRLNCIYEINKADWQAQHP